MSEQQNQRKTSLTDEKFSKYNKWCSKTSITSFDNNNNRNFANNSNNAPDTNFNANHIQDQPQAKRRFNNGQEWQTSYKQSNNGAFTFNPNAYYHSSMLEDPWLNLNNKKQ